MSTLASVFGYGLLSARAAASVAGRFYYATDTNLMYRDNGSTWDTLTILGAGSGTLTTVEEVDGSPTDSAVTKIKFPNGTLGISSHVATYTPAPPTETESYLTGNVDMTPADTFVDVVSLSLNGTYLIIADVLLQGVGGSGAVGITARLTNGTAIPLSTEVWDKEPGGSYMPVTLHAWVTTSGSETWKVQAACRVNHGTVLASAAHNGTTNKATVIRAIQFA